MWDLTYALTEEIGDPDLFVGREQEMARPAGLGRRARSAGSRSPWGLLSRRKKGKTALLQRFFNILYTRQRPTADPVLLPHPGGTAPQDRLFASVLLPADCSASISASPPARRSSSSRFCPSTSSRNSPRDDRHVAADIRAYGGHPGDRVPRRGLALRPRGRSSDLGRLNDVRILQILDEFQYLNRWIVSDDGRTRWRSSATPTWEPRRARSRPRSSPAATSAGWAPSCAT